MTNYTIERLLQRAIYEGLLINNLAREELAQKGQDYLEGLSSNNIDQMDDIIDLIREEYPAVEGIYLNEFVNEFINNVIDCGADINTIHWFGRRQLEELAEVYTDCIMKLVKGYSKIAGAGKG